MLIRTMLIMLDLDRHKNPACGKRILIAGLAALLLLISASPGAGQTPDRPFVVRIAYPTRDDLAEIAQYLDVWHVDPETRRAVAAVSEAEIRWLREHGFEVSQAPALNAAPLTIPGYPCYRTVADLDAQIAQWEADYPHLVKRITIGTSHEGRDLTVLRLGAATPGTAHPTLFLMAGVHGRELISNEVAASFLERLLTGDGVDPDVTWLLDHHLIYVLITANPDGHVKNEPGEPWAYWRKNTNPTYGCEWSTYGVDLNRNSSFQWQAPGGLSTCNNTYPGPSAGSEPETAAIEAFVRTLFPDQRPPALDAPAPDNATGIFITLHSYSNLVLWPWGHTYDDAPNAAQLARLGRTMAAFNGYTPQQASDLYPAAGTNDNWAYGELGIAAYTFEIGSSYDGFYPLCSRYDALVEPNLDALFYAARVARAPYQLPFGPDVLRIHKPAPAIAPLHAGIAFSATLGYRGWSGTTIIRAEAYVDVLPWEGGTAIPLTPVDGAFDTSDETVTGMISPTLSIGRHLLYVRGQGDGGWWGPVSAVFVDVIEPFTLTPAAQLAGGRPDTTVTVPLTLTNRSDLTHTIALSSTANAWPTALSPGSGTLMPNGWLTASVAVTIPANALGWPGPTEVVTVTTRSIQTPTLQHKAVVDVQSRPFVLWFPRFFKKAVP